MESGSRIAIRPGRGADDPGAAPLLELLDSSVRADLHRHYARLRRAGPLHRIMLRGRRAWAVPRYEDCLALLTDARFAHRADSRAPLLFHDAVVAGPLERRVADALTPRAVEGLRLRLAEAASALLDRAGRRGELDLVRDYAVPLAVVGPCELLGVAPADRPLLAAWACELERGASAEEALATYFSEHVHARRRSLGDDLLGARIEADAARGTLDDDDLVAFCVALLRAAGGTAAALIANGALAVLSHPAQARQLARDASLVIGAVEECARWDSPIQVTGRVATQDLVFRDVAIAAGQVVWALLGSANRDPEFFEDAALFQIARRGPPHLAFGFGAHYCPAAHLARVKAQIALRLLVQRLPGLRPAAERPERHPSLQVWMPERLRVTLLP